MDVLAEVLNGVRFYDRFPIDDTEEFVWFCRFVGYGKEVFSTMYRQSIPCMMKTHSLDTPYRLAVLLVHHVLIPMVDYVYNDPIRKLCIGLLSYAKGCSDDEKKKKFRDLADAIKEKRKEVEETTYKFENSTFPAIEDKIKGFINSTGVTESFKEVVSDSMLLEFMSSYPSYIQLSILDFYRDKGILPDDVCVELRADLCQFARQGFFHSLSHVTDYAVSQCPFNTVFPQSSMEYRVISVAECRCFGWRDVYQTSIGIDWIEQEEEEEEEEEEDEYYYAPTCDRYEWHQRIQTLLFIAISRGDISYLIEWMEIHDSSNATDISHGGISHLFEWMIIDDDEPNPTLIELKKRYSTYLKRTVSFLIKEKTGVYIAEHLINL